MATKSPRHPARVPSVAVVRSLLASVPPRSSVLPPGAGNEEAKKALKADDEGAKKTEDRTVRQTCVVQGHLDTPTIRTNRDGDVASIATIEQTQDWSPAHAQPIRAVRAVYEADGDPATIRTAPNNPGGRRIVIRSWSERCRGEADRARPDCARPDCVRPDCVRPDRLRRSRTHPAGIPLRSTGVSAPNGLFNEGLRLVTPTGRVSDRLVPVVSWSGRGDNVAVDQVAQQIPVGWVSPPARSQRQLRREAGSTLHRDRIQPGHKETVGRPTVSSPPI